MKQFSLKRLALSAVALLIVGVASAATEVKVYDFTNSNNNLNPSTTTSAISVTADRSYSCIYLSDGSNTFDNKFAWGCRWDGSTTETTNVLFRNAGLYWAYQQRVLAILELKKGDVITFNISSGSFTARNSILQGVKADDALTSGKRYFVKTAGNQVIYTANTSSLHSVVIESETEYIGQGEVVATPASDTYNDRAINSANDLIEAQFKNWERISDYKTDWPTDGAIRTAFNVFTAGSCAQSSTSVTETSNLPTAGPYVEFTPKYNGRLEVFGDFVGVTKLASSALDVQASYATGWQVMNFKVTADTKYYLWSTTSSRRRIRGYRFTPEFGIAMPSIGKATFGNYANATFYVPTGMKAYAAKYSSGDDQVSMDEVTAINYQQAVFLTGTAKYCYAFTKGASMDNTNYEENVLKTVSSEFKLVPSTSDYYIFGKKGDDEGFYKVASTGYTSAAGKAYLDIPAASAPMLWLNFEDNQTTGVNEVRSKMEEVRGIYYNLAGQRVDNPTKGLYIVNGRMVVIK